MIFLTTQNWAKKDLGPIRICFLDHLLKTEKHWRKQYSYMYLIISNNDFHNMGPNLKLHNRYWNTLNCSINSSIEVGSVSGNWISAGSKKILYGNTGVKSSIPFWSWVHKWLSPVFVMQCPKRKLTRLKIIHGCEKKHSL